MTKFQWPFFIPTAPFFPLANHMPEFLQILWTHGTTSPEEDAIRLRQDPGMFYALPFEDFIKTHLAEEFQNYKQDHNDDPTSNH